LTQNNLFNTLLIDEVIMSVSGSGDALLGKQLVAINAQIMTDAKDESKAGTLSSDSLSSITQDCADATAQLNSMGTDIMAAAGCAENALMQLQQGNGSEAKASLNDAVNYLQSAASDIEPILNDFSDAISLLERGTTNSEAKSCFSQAQAFLNDFNQSMESAQAAFQEAISALQEIPNSSPESARMDLMNAHMDLMNALTFIGQASMNLSMALMTLQTAGQALEMPQS
jgi:hypothetical protein